MHGGASFLLNDYGYVLFNGNKRQWQGCWFGNQTLAFCAVAERDALMQVVSQMVGAEENTGASVCADAGQGVTLYPNIWRWAHITIPKGSTEMHRS